MTDLLSIEGLSVSLDLDGRRFPVLQDVSLRVGEGDFVGLVGESGSGKSLMALSVLRLLPPQARVEAGRVMFMGRDLLTLPDSEMRRVRGAGIGFVFQEPMTTLDPVFSVGFQVAEAVRAHRPISRRRARAEAERLLDLVGISPAAQRYDDYPHELSGGQLQRVVLAAALAAEPKLLIADEPTSALDVAVQAEILGLFEELEQRLGLAVLLITHDLSVVAGMCDTVSVLYAGQIVESAPTPDLFGQPVHPYTHGLLASLPRLGEPRIRGRMTAIPGQPPVLGEEPEGCSFHPRCSEVMERCRTERPQLVREGAGRSARCFLSDGSKSESEVAG